MVLHFIMINLVLFIAQCSLLQWGVSHAHTVSSIRGAAISPLFTWSGWKETCQWKIVAQCSIEPQQFKMHSFWLGFGWGHASTNTLCLTNDWTTVLVLNLALSFSTIAAWIYYNVGKILSWVVLGRFPFLVHDQTDLNLSIFSLIRYHLKLSVLISKQFLDFQTVFLSF